MNHIRPHVGDQPIDQLLNLLSLVAGLAAKHRHGHVAQLGRLDAHAALRHLLQQARMIQQPIHPPRRAAKHRELLLQIDVDAAEEHAANADVRLVGPERRVGRHQQHVFAQIQERGGQRVVVQTTAAVHARRSGRDVGDLHPG